jgi:hypothetical protein
MTSAGKHVASAVRSGRAVIARGPAAHAERSMMPTKLAVHTGSRTRTFPLAPMSPMIRGFTVLVLLVPLLFLAPAAFGKSLLVVPGLLLVAMYVWIWLFMRPIRFVVAPYWLEVVWPLKQRRLVRRDIANIRLIDAREVRSEVGWGMRVGIGGLWGAFGWLWTQRRGIVQMYISRTDGLVWIEQARGRAWLITPEQPEEFVRALSGETPLH